MTTVEVVIEVAGQNRLVGQAYFTRGRRGEISTTFIYDPSYISEDGTNIDPALVLDPGVQYQAGLLRAFADSAPDRWGRNLLNKAERLRARDEGRVPRRLDDLDYLLGVSDDTRQGALRFRLTGSDVFVGPPSRVPKLVRFPNFFVPVMNSHPTASMQPRSSNSWKLELRVLGELVRRHQYALTMEVWRSPNSHIQVINGMLWRGKQPRLT